MNAKKILAGACASLMLAVAAAPAVSAADSIGVTVGKAEAKPGATFTVNIDLTDIPAAGVNACDFGIKYDSSVISIDKVEAGKLAKDETDLEGVDALVANTDEPGLVSILYGLGVDGNVMTDGGTFLVLTGTVKADAKAGSKSDLEVVAVDRNATDEENSPLNTDIVFGYLVAESATMYEPTITPGLVKVLGDSTEASDPTQATTTKLTTPAPTIPPETLPSNIEIDDLKYGDVNLDGAVTGADTVKLAKYMLSKESYPLGKGDTDTEIRAKLQGDVKKDGTLGTSDTMRLNEYNLKNITEDVLGTP